MRDDLVEAPEFIYEQYRVPELEIPINIAPTGNISTVNGLGGNVVLGGGVTGLSFSTAAPNVNLSGTLVVASGGTGSTTAAGARSNLGAAVSGNNTDITKLLGLSGGLRFIGFTSSTTDPTTTELTADGDMAIHRNTTSTNIFLAFRFAGAIFKVQLT